MKKVFLVKRPGLADDNPTLLKIKREFQVCRMAKSAEAIAVLGGDGSMLGAVRRFWHLGIPFVGLNLGNYGFNMNPPTDEVIEEIKAGKFDQKNARLIKGKLFDQAGRHMTTAIALQDIYFRVPRGSMRGRVLVDGIVRHESVLADGLLVSSAIGSTAYSASANNMIVPMDSDTLLVSALLPVRYSRWQNVQLSGKSTVTLEVLDYRGRRVVPLFADNREYRKVAKVDVSYSDKSVTLLFAKSHNYLEKLYRVQFNQA